MKLLNAISLLLVTMSSFGQTEINQLTEKGQKIGEWVDFLENGKIDKVTYYEPTTRILTKEEAFSRGLAAYKDSTIYYEVYLWKEKYEYTVNWDLKRILRTENSKVRPAYYYGPNKEIAIDSKSLDYFFTGRVDSIQSIEIKLTNTSQNTILLKPQFNSNNIISTSKEFVLPANESSIFELNLTFEANSNSYNVMLKNDSIDIEFSLKTFGYHVDSKDVEIGRPLSLGKSFTYHRTGTEALLKLFDADKKKELQTFSVAKEWTSVDLSKIKSGRYFLCIVDYKLKREVFCEVNIE